MSNNVKITYLDTETGAEYEMEHTLYVGCDGVPSVQIFIDGVLCCDDSRCREVKRIAGEAIDVHDFVTGGGRIAVKVEQIETGEDLYSDFPDDPVPQKI